MISASTRGELMEQQGQSRRINAAENALLLRCESAPVEAFTPFAQQAAPVGELIGLRLANGQRVLVQFAEPYAGELVNGAALVSWIRLESVAVEMGAGMVLEEISKQQSSDGLLETPASVTEEGPHDDAAQG